MNSQPNLVRLCLAVALGAVVMGLAACGGNGASAPPVTMVTVPDVLGLPQDDAETAVTSANLVPGAISQESWMTMPTGAVVGQNPPAGTVIAENSTVDLVLVRPPPAAADEVIQNSWVGEWQFTFTFMDAVNNTIVGVNQFSVPMCAGDPVGWTLMQQVGTESPNLSAVNCTGSAFANDIDVSCSTHVENTLCPADVSFQVAMDLHGNTMIGSGLWTPSLDCVLPTAVDGESFVISSVRIDSDPTLVCASPISSLVQKLMPLIVGHFLERLP